MRHAMRISRFITTILHCSDRESKTKKRKYVLTHSLISVQFFTSYKHKVPLDVISVRCCGLQFRWGRESLQEEEQNTQTKNTEQDFDLFLQITKIPSLKSKSTSFRIHHDHARQI